MLKNDLTHEPKSMFINVSTVKTEVDNIKFNKTKEEADCKV